MIKNSHKINVTVIDLFIGILIYGIIFEILGILLVKGKGTYTLGLLFGIIVALGLVVHMYVTLDKALDMDQVRASRYMVKNSLLRALVMLVAVGIGLYLEQVSFVAILIGIIGLKISAFLQPFTNQYITKKLFNERG